MKKFLLFLLCGTILICLTPTGHGQFPQKKDFQKGPPKFQLGRVLPPLAREDLNLTDEQNQQIQELEKMVREHLQKILTPQQIEKLNDLPPKGPKGGKKEGFEPPGRKGKEKKGGGPLAIERTTVGGGIQWFATWESGWRQAQKTGQPILLVSAAPHCAGVSGVW